MWCRFGFGVWCCSFSGLIAVWRATEVVAVWVAGFVGFVLVGCLAASWFTCWVDCCLVICLLVAGLLFVLGCLSAVVLGCLLIVLG